jgi:hypothetical protein
MRLDALHQRFLEHCAVEKRQAFGVGWPVRTHGLIAL